MKPPPFSPEPLLLPREAAAALRCDPKTLARWASQGKIPCIRTLGGHRRFRQSDIEFILRGAR